MGCLCYTAAKVLIAQANAVTVVACLPSGRATPAISARRGQSHGPRGRATRGSQHGCNAARWLSRPTRSYTLMILAFGPPTCKGERMTPIYRFFNWDGAQDGYGAYGFAMWQTLHTGPGEYNWEPIDSWLQKQAGKPTAFAIATHLSQLDGWESFADCTPAWVYDGMGRPEMHGRPVGKIVTVTDKDGKVTSAACPTTTIKPDGGAFAGIHHGDGRALRRRPALTAVFAGPGWTSRTSRARARSGTATSRTASSSCAWPTRTGTRRRSPRRRYSLW